jgi:hypothetical protein
VAVRRVERRATLFALASRCASGARCQLSSMKRRIEVKSSVVWSIAPCLA